jgi:integrase
MANRKKERTKHPGIYRRGSRYIVVVTAGHGADGRPRQVQQTHRTIREAVEARARLRSHLADGHPIISARVTLAELLTRWLRDYARGAVAPTTLASYQSIVEKHLIPTLGGVSLRKLGPGAIQQMYARKLEEGLSPATVHYIHAVLREALGHAVKWGMLGSNPATRTSPPRPRSPEFATLDSEQVRLFLAEAKRSSPHYVLYLSAVFTGARQGELLGLRWQDVDLALGALAIRQKLYRLRDRILISEPKTRAGKRSLPIPPALVEELRRVQEAQNEVRRALETCPEGIECRNRQCVKWHETGLVFAQQNGKPLHGLNITQDDLRRVLKRAGLPRIRFHDLRHGHASWLLEVGVNPKVVAERLGHHSPAFTLHVYSHTIQGMQTRAVQDLAERLGFADDSGENRKT